MYLFGWPTAIKGRTFFLVEICINNHQDVNDSNRYLTPICCTARGQILLGNNNSKDCALEDYATTRELPPRKETYFSCQKF